MNLADQYLIFTLEKQRFALGLSGVDKVIRSVEVSPLPENQDLLLGLINMQGQILPVLNIRRHFSLPSREIDINDRIIISHTSDIMVAFIVDTVEGVVEISKKQVNKAKKIFPRLEDYIESVGKLKDDTVLIYNLDNFLSTKDVDQLKNVVKKNT